MSLALSICVLFISLMQSVNGAQFLNITSLSLLPPPAANAATDIDYLKSDSHLPKKCVLFTSMKAY